MHKIQQQTQQLIHDFHLWPSIKTKSNIFQDPDYFKLLCLGLTHGILFSGASDKEVAQHGQKAGKPCFAYSKHSVPVYCPERRESKQTHLYTLHVFISRRERDREMEGEGLSKRRRGLFFTLTLTLHWLYIRCWIKQLSEMGFRWLCSHCKSKHSIITCFITFYLHRLIKCW